MNWWGRWWSLSPCGVEVGGGDDVQGVGADLTIRLF